ncbi:hypothetical protein SAMN05660443_1970 [Marinospirillum celere]|uniref:SHOCT domain-containing protein n=1 Tax=Marinospirillum celere TaxID=1122252 RepID=A0A1I1HR34_9GAMM|nr:SHOCT domain-containing protein [Marinospirillum celere]SFC26326.1 hypothetical protein SAMN05660443_1970 [Marinospirillum celere]
MQTNLKTLSRQYANGLLTKDDYRQARADLIDQAQDNDYTEPQTTIPLDDTESGSSEPTEPPSSANQRVDTSSGDDRKCRQKNQLLMSLIVLLAVALGYLAWS